MLGVTIQWLRRATFLGFAILLLVAASQTAPATGSPPSTSPTSAPTVGVAAAGPSAAASPPSRPTVGASPEPAASPAIAAASPAAATTAPPATAAQSETLVTAVRSVSKQVRPAVVQITNQQQVQTSQFKQPFIVPAGVGSGVLYGAQGHILTSNHVLAGA